MWLYLHDDISLIENCIKFIIIIVDDYAAHAWLCLYMTGLNAKKIFMIKHFLQLKLMFYKCSLLCKFWSFASQEGWHVKIWMMCIRVCVCRQR